METTRLYELRKELVALDDWLSACREQIAELTQELKMIGGLGSHPQNVGQCLNSEMNIAGQRQGAAGPKKLIH